MLWDKICLVLLFRYIVAKTARLCLWRLCCKHKAMRTTALVGTPAACSQLEYNHSTPESHILASTRIVRRPHTLQALDRQRNC